MGHVIRRREPRRVERAVVALDDAERRVVGREEDALRVLSSRTDTSTNGWQLQWQSFHSHHVDDKKDGRARGRSTPERGGSVLPNKQDTANNRNHNLNHTHNQNPFA